MVCLDPGILASAVTSGYDLSESGNTASRPLSRLSLRQISFTIHAVAGHGLPDSSLA
jgi:hypothetical protein